jgi:hypothetical protein
VIGRFATFDSSSVRYPSQPGSTYPAVEWISRPRRPRLDLPSSRATRSSGSATRSIVAEDELAGVQDEGLVAGHLHHLRQGRHLAPHVDVGIPRVGEDAELPVDVQIDRRGLDARVVERVDLDAARRELLADVDVGQDHRGRMLPVPRGRHPTHEHVEGGP